MKKKKSKTSREIARIISEDISSQRKQASLIARPLRLAFIIRDNLSFENLWYLLTYISSIWGGYYSCLIPTDGENISDVDWESLSVYEPDKVVFCSNDKNGFVPDLVAKIKKEIAPFSLLEVDDWDVEKDIFNLGMKRDADPLVYSIPITVAMVHDLDKLKKPIEEDKSNVRIPDVSSVDALSFYVAAQVGLVSGHNKKLYLDWYKAKNIGFNNSNVKEYLSQLAEIEGKFSPLDMTKLFTRTSITIRGVVERPEGLNVVLAGSNFVQDLCLFWNLRLAQSFFKKSIVLFLPFEFVNSKNSLKEFVEGVRLTPWSHSKINIFSASVSLSKLKRFHARLRTLLGSDVKINLVEDAIPVAYFHTISTEETSETRIEENTFSFKSLKPEFSDLAKGGDWAVDIKFKTPYEYPSFAEINHFLCGSPKEYFYNFHRGYWVRAAHEKFVHRVNSKTSFLTGHLVSDEQAYKGFFQDKGFLLRLTEKHSYVEGFLRLIQNPDILEDTNVMDVLWKLHKQEAYTYDGLCAELKKGEDGGVLVDEFVSKRILIRGMEFRCGVCGLLRFYPFNTLDEEVQCPGCLSYLQPPSRAPIMFRLNELVARAVEQGSIPVALTHKFLKRLSSNQTLRLFGSEISNDELKIDADYITTYQGALVLAECKDFKQGVLPKEKKSAIQQLANLVRLAKRVNAPIVILSTLLPYPSSDYDDIVRQIQKMRNKTKISIHLLSLSRNGIVNLKQPEKLVEHPFLFD